MGRNIIDILSYLQSESPVVPQLGFQSVSFHNEHVPLFLQVPNCNSSGLPHTGLALELLFNRLQLNGQMQQVPTQSLKVREHI